MKQLYLKCIILAILSLICITANAYDCKVNGIYYNLDETTKTASVTNNSPSFVDAYSGTVTIPSNITHNRSTYSVTSIGSSAFSYCEDLTSVTIPNSVTKIGSSAFRECLLLESINIPNSVTIIDSYSFLNCYSLTSITIPNSVTDIGSNSFAGCQSLTSITIPSSVTSIKDYAFKGCSSLTSVTIPNSVTRIENSAFYGCEGLTSVTIPDSLTTIEDNTFENCKSLISITIPNTVTSIRHQAFYGCYGLTSILLSDNLKFVGHNAFYGCSAKLYVNNGTVSLITLWNNGYTPYEIGTDQCLKPSSLSLLSSTLTSITLRINNYSPYFTYTCNELSVSSDLTTINNLNPDTKYSFTFRTSKGDFYYETTQEFSTRSIINDVNVSTTASSVVANGFVEEGALIKSQTLRVNGVTFEGSQYTFRGLEPNTSYNVVYTVTDESFSYTKSISVKTKELNITTSQPKVISSGNVIVAAETNLDNEETNVGFEWRRTDWTDDFTSNSGTAYLYNGVMEGYIRNLNTEKLWKYRPYYTSNAGKTYYGEWVGIDPTNTSYFEPTIHTYANVSVNGNSVEVKGYVQRGTDNVVSKGFAYWKQSEDVKSRDAMSAPSMISSLPSNAKTVEVSGSQQVMTASLSNLEYETTYCYVAFVRTSEGDTYYGEPREFTTDIDVTGIRDVDNDKTVTVIQRYDQNGLRLSSPRRGLNILIMSDGSTKKVWVK